MNQATEERVYTIDELSSHTGVPSRTIRFYQSKGALQAPTMKGRKAFYAEHHVERLELIGTLQDRGLQIRAIRNLLTQVEEGKHSIDEWLGLGDQLEKPWTEDEAKLMSEEEIKELLKGRRAGLLGSLLRVGTLEKRSHQYFVRSPVLLNMALAVEDAGVDIEVGKGATDILDKHLSKAAAELSAYFVDGVGKSIACDQDAEGVAAFVDNMKPIALDTVRVMFAHRVEGELRRILSEGKLFPANRRSSEKTMSKRKGKKR